MKLAVTLTTVVLAATGAAAAFAEPCDTGCDSGTGGGTTIPKTGGPKSSPTPQPDTRQRHVEVKLISVTAQDTEDVFGGDEFYALGSVSSDGWQHAEFVTSELAIGDSETRAINKTVFSGDLAGDDPLDVAIDSFDHDAGEVLKHVPEVIKLVGDLCAPAVPFDPTGLAEACAAGAPVLAPIVTWLSPRLVDADDTLDTWGIRKTRVSAYPPGTTHEPHHFVGGSGLGRYEYTVNYDVIVTLK